MPPHHVTNRSREVLFSGGSEYNETCYAMTFGGDYSAQYIANLHKSTIEATNTIQTWFPILHQAPPTPR
jgi:hypothetical protein